MAKRTTVVISQGQSQNPAKRDLEENLVAALIMEPGIEVVVVPHLYDLKADGTGVIALQGIPGPVVVLSWLYERAARWILDRYGVHGKIGVTLLRSNDETDEDADELREAQSQAAEEAKDGAASEETGDKLRVIEQRTTPARRVYCIDLRVHAKVEPYVEEIRRIAEENRLQLVQLGDWIGGAPSPTALARFESPTNDTAIGGSGPTVAAAASAAASEAAQALRIVEATERRWYPVIDFSRCTNCMECIDFCLFGVYGVDKSETILVEQPDNCRKGCPACSRVCPENAIMFPQHKTPAIAGAPAEAAGALKIDLSKLFGAPEGAVDAFEMAARERDEQLLAAGREAVGMSVGMPKRQTSTGPAGPKDELDNLIDALDDLNL
ncbi:MAG: ferredoxin family protein [Pirellulales bacterium]